MTTFGTTFGANALWRFFSKSAYNSGGVDLGKGCAGKNLWNDVVIVTMSEFGRTSAENASVGTDHAEAGVMFAAGGGIKGYSAAENRSGVYNCSPGDPIPWTTGPTGSMFGVNGRYLRRVTDYRQINGPSSALKQDNGNGSL